MGWERRRIREGGTGCGHVAFLSAAETAPFFKTSILLFRGKLLQLFLGVDVHGIGVPGGSASSGGGGMESDWSPG